ncbi:hypothetical protein LS684_21660 (plasmid) [Cytobacillus spongiae]|uniref:hypothetical protein n=1 Tax=Cytobacillus spongiae TaxID=2901381 RepID=UPI001F3742BA|nr:hypothetical protein [Cytobacillus spongiae]UII58716.1 hypothetical protein LS684_21660 [Cytobacillus spongiae]
MEFRNTVFMLNRHDEMDVARTLIIEPTNETIQFFLYSSTFHLHDPSKFVPFFIIAHYSI